MFVSAVTYIIFKHSCLTVSLKCALEICNLLSAAAAESPTIISYPEPGDGVTESITGFNK